MKTKFITFTRILLILLVLAAIGYFVLPKNDLEIFNTKKVEYYPEKSESPTMPPSTVEDDTVVDWETYTNQKYNFEFKYPPESRLIEQSEEHIAVSFMGEKQKASGRTQTELFDGYAFNVVDVTGSGYEDLDDFYKQKVNQLEEVCTEIGDRKETTISGRRAITHSLSCLGDYDAYYFKDDETYFEISLLHVGDEEDLPTYTEIVNKILSTFKFEN